MDLVARYNREAADYRELWAPVLRIAALRLLDSLEALRPGRILDLGTGVGTLVPDVRARFPGAAILGADRSPGMLALAPGDCPRAVMDARELALPAACMDLALLVFMLFHLEEPLAALREARRVLRPGGTIAALTWGSELESAALDAWLAGLDSCGAPPPDPAAEARHAALDRPEKVEAMLLAAGFHGVRSWPGELEYSFDPRHFLRLRTRMGASRTRLESLPPDVRERFLAEFRRRMETLTPADFLARGAVVHAVGVA